MVGVIWAVAVLLRGVEAAMRAQRPLSPMRELELSWGYGAGPAARARRLTAA